MLFEEVDDGPYRIYAAALQVPGRKGYIAAVVVSRRGGTLRDPLEAYRNENIAEGHAWPTAEDALYYAVAKAKAVIRVQRHRLAC